MGIKPSDLGAQQAQDSVLSFVRVRTGAIVTGLWWRKRSTSHDAGPTDMRLMVSHSYINIDRQEMKRRS